MAQAVEPSFDERMTYAPLVPMCALRSEQQIVEFNIDSNGVQTGETYEHTFDTVGTFDSAYTPHPWMAGQIEVTAKSGARRTYSRGGSISMRRRLPFGRSVALSAAPSVIQSSARTT